MATIADLLIKIGADGSGLSSELNKSKQEINSAFNTTPLNEFSNRLTGVSHDVEGLMGTFARFAGVAAAGFGLNAVIGAAVDAGESVYQLQQRFQLSAEEAVKLSSVMKMTGGDADTAAKAMMRLDKGLLTHSEDGKRAEEVFKALGISMTDAGGKLKPITGQLEELAKGYKKANDAGQGQEFIMATLGARGLGLSKTLLNYAEASERAAKVQGVGLDPKQMHEAHMQMQELSLQMGKLGTVAGSALAPVALELLPQITSGLAGTARWVKENKELVTSTLGTLAKLVAAYEAVKIAKAGMTVVGTAVSAVRNAAQDKAAESEQAALTKAQERRINKSIADSERMYSAMRREAIKTAEQQDLSAAETQQFLAKKFTEIGIQAAESAERIRLSMTEAFAQINLAAEESAGVVNTALADNGIVARDAAVAKIEANETVITSNRAVAESEIATGVAAEEAAATKMTAAESEVAANARVAESNEAVTVAAAEAGAAEVRASESAVIAAEENTVALGKVATAHTTTGVQAVAAGTKSIGVLGKVGGAAKVAGKALFALAGGWIGVGAAALYAAYCAVQYFHAKYEEGKANTWESGGVRYTAHDGKIWREGQSDNSNVAADPTGLGSVAAGGINETALDPDSDEYAQQYGNWYNAGGGKAWEEAEKQRKAAEEAAQKANSNLDLDLSRGKGSYSEDDLRRTILGYMDANQGRNYKGFECTIYVKTGLQGAGVDTSGMDNELYAGAETQDRDANAANSSWIQEAKRRGAWHPTDEYGNGYNAKPGDVAIVENGNHTITIGQGGYYSASGTGRQSSFYGQDYRASYGGNVVGIIDSAALAGMGGLTPKTQDLDWGSNQNWAAIKRAAEEFHKDPYLALAMSAVETGGGDINAVNMADGGGLFQILDGGQDAVTANGQRGSVAELFPGWETDPLQNARAGMAVLSRKKDLTGTDETWANVEAYNGGGDPDYVEKVKKAYYGMHKDSGMTAQMTRLLEGRKELRQLEQELQSTLSKSDATQYEQDTAKLEQFYQSREAKLKEIKSKGVDTKDAEKLLDRYNTSEINRIAAELQSRQEKLKEETEKINDELSGSFTGMVEDEYRATVESLRKQREVKQREVAADKYDKAAMKQVDDWYNASVLAALKKRTDAMREAHEKEIQYSITNGDGKGLQKLLNSQAQKDVMEWQAKQKACQSYYEIWQKANQTTTDMIAEGSTSIASDMAEAFESMISGSQGAGKAFENLGKSIMSTIAKTVAQVTANKIAMMLFGGALGGSGGGGLGGFFSGGGSSFMSNIVGGYSGGYASGFSYGGGFGGLSIPHFANGGLVTAPTVGIMGEVGYHEAVMPLNDNVYSRIGQGIARNTAGGVGVMGAGTPVVNIINNSNNNVRVQSSNYDDQLKKWVLNIVVDATETNEGGMAQAVRNAAKG